MKILPMSSHNEVLGVMVDGRDLRIAHLARQGSEIAILNLETVSLHHRLGKIKAPTAVTPGGMEDAGKDIFGFEDNSPQRTEEMYESAPEEGDSSALLVSAFSKYMDKRLATVVNVPEGQATYYNFESDFGLKGKKLQKRLQDEISPLTGGTLDMATLGHFVSSSGALTAVVSEGNIPLIDELLTLKSFLPTPPAIRGVNTNEIALINLARSSLDLQADEITAVVYIGNDFSRIIMLRGEQPISFLQTIREGFQSPHICQTLFSKILLEQEEAGISEVHQIVLTGEIGVPRAHDFFSKQFPDAKVQLITPGVLNTQLLSAEQIAMFPNYAIPVALAWEMVDRKNSRFIRTNLLPTSVRDGQKFFRMSWHGFALLGGIFALMLLLSYQGISRWSHIRSLNHAIVRDQQAIDVLQPDLAYIDQLQTQISDYRQNLNFMDSLIVDPGKWSRLFGKFMQDFKSVNRIWIDNIKSEQDGFAMVGKTLVRDRVPKLAACLPSIDLKRVTRVINENGEITYEYELTAGIPAPDTTRAENPFQPGTDKVNTPGGTIAAEMVSLPSELPQTSDPDLMVEANPPAENTPAEASSPDQGQVMQGPPPPPASGDSQQLAAVSKETYDRGIQLVQSNDLTGAEETFSSLLQQYPNSNWSASAYYWLGECRYAKRDYAAAVEDFVASLNYEGNTKREAALLMLGITYVRLGQDEKAKAQFEALLQEFPEGEFSQKAHRFIQQLTTQG